MEIRSISSKLDGPKPRIETPKVVWPRYLDNKETHDHLSGKKLSIAVLEIELEKLKVIWSQTQQTRHRYAVYEFLEAAYAVVVKFSRIGKGKRLLRKVHQLDPLSARIRDPYAAVIHFGTAHSLDSRTRSKWSRVLQAAERKKKTAHRLEGFIRSCGGINKCASG